MESWKDLFYSLNWTYFKSWKAWVKIAQMMLILFSLVMIRFEYLETAKRSPVIRDEIFASLFVLFLTPIIAIVLHLVGFSINSVAVYENIVFLIFYKTSQTIIDEIVKGSKIDVVCLVIVPCITISVQLLEATLTSRAFRAFYKVLRARVRPIVAMMHED